MKKLILVLLFFVTVGYSQQTTGYLQLDSGYTQPSGISGYGRLYGRGSNLYWIRVSGKDTVILAGRNNILTGTNRFTGDNSFESGNGLVIGKPAINQGYIRFQNAVNNYQTYLELSGTPSADKELLLPILSTAITTLGTVDGNQDFSNVGKVNADSLTANNLINGKLLSSINGVIVSTAKDTNSVLTDSVLNAGGTGVAVRKVGTTKTLKRLKGTNSTITVTDATDSITVGLNLSNRNTWLTDIKLQTTGLNTNSPKLIFSNNDVPDTAYFYLNNGVLTSSSTGSTGSITYLPTDGISTNIALNHALAGGTGLTTWTAGDIPYAATTNPTALSKLGIGAANSVLTSSGSAPQYSTSLSLSGTITVDTVYGSTAANGDIEISGTSSATRTTSYLNLQPNGGLVGIGTRTPSQTLDIQRTVNGEHAIYTSNYSSGSSAYSVMRMTEAGDQQKSINIGYNPSTYTPNGLFSAKRGIVSTGASADSGLYLYTQVSGAPLVIGGSTYPGTEWARFDDNGSYYHAGGKLAINSSGQIIKKNNLVMEGGNDFAHDTVVNFRSTNLAATNYANVSGAGDYEVYGYFQVTTGGTGVATATVTIGYTDDIGATTNNVVNAIVATGTSRNTFMLPIHVASGNITYAITLAGTTNPTVKLSTWIRKVN